MSSSLAGPVPSRIGVRSMTTVTYLSPRRVWRRTMGAPPAESEACGGIVHADHGHAVEPGLVIDQDPSALREDGVVRGIPRRTQRLSDPGDRQMLADRRNQGPTNNCPRQLRPWLGCGSGVLAPHPSADRATVAAHPHQQRDRPPPERLVRQPPGHRAPWRSLGPALSAEHVTLPRYDAALQHATVGLQALPHHDEAELVQAREGRQVRAVEGSVAHVEVFWMGWCQPPIIRGPRPISRPDHATAATPSDRMSLETSSSSRPASSPTPSASTAQHSSRTQPTRIEPVDNRFLMARLP